MLYYSARPNKGEFLGNLLHVKLAKDIECGCTIYRKSVFPCGTGNGGSCN
jgi:hypothetical protein